MAWTIRCDSLELWQGLVLHAMGEIDFHVFGKYWKLTSSPNTSKLVLGPPGWSSDCFESQEPINLPTNKPQQKISGNLDNLPTSSFLTNWLPFYFMYSGVILFLDFPWIDFPWIFHGGRRPTTILGSVGGAGAPPTKKRKNS